MKLKYSILIFATLISTVLNASIPKTQFGIASYYSSKLQGRATSSGQPYNKHRFTAAHKTLPLGTQVKVTDPNSHQSVIVTINDRGPHCRGRIIDLSYAAAQQINLVRSGTSKVKIEVVKFDILSIF